MEQAHLGSQISFSPSASCVLVSVRIWIHPLHPSVSTDKMLYQQKMEKCRRKAPRCRLIQPRSGSANCGIFRSLLQQWVFLAFQWPVAVEEVSGHLCLNSWSSWSADICRYFLWISRSECCWDLTAARRLNGQKNAHNQVYRASALVLLKGGKQRPRRMMNWSLILSYVKKLSMLSSWGTLHCQWTHPPEPHESALCCSELHSDSTVTQVCTNTGSCSRYVIYCNSTKNVILRFLLLAVSKEFFSWFDVTDLWYLFVLWTEKF